MSIIQDVDWKLIQFLAGSTALDYYLYKHLTWRIAVCLPKDIKDEITSN